MRAASDLTVSIRELLKKNPDLSHKNARPKLIEGGFDLCPEDADRESPEWKAEANAFNSIKYQYRLANGFVNPKPKSGKGRSKAVKPGKVVRNVRRVARTARPVAEPVFTGEEAVAYLSEFGGVAKVKAEIAKLKGEIAKHEAALAAADNLQKMLDKVAA